MPYTPLAAFAPLRWAISRTFWRGFQYLPFLVRKITWLAAVQYQAPTAGLSLRTSRARSTDFLSVISRSKVTVIGIPTPTFSPGEGMTSEIPKVCSAFRVLKVLAAVAVLFSVLAAVASTR
ncbi:hypothetical protein GCM10027589_10880 [Actinocorallia lasiicapitis]